MENTPKRQKLNLKANTATTQDTRSAHKLHNNTWKPFRGICVYPCKLFLAEKGERGQNRWSNCSLLKGPNFYGIGGLTKSLTHRQTQKILPKTKFLAHVHTAASWCESRIKWAVKTMHNSIQSVLATRRNSGILFSLDFLNTNPKTRQVWRCFWRK